MDDMNAFRVFVCVFGWLFGVLGVARTKDLTDKKKEDCRYKKLAWTKALGVSIVLFVASGFLMDYSELPDFNSFDRSFDSALGRTIGAWFGTALAVGSSMLFLFIASVIALVHIALKEAGAKRSAINAENKKYKIQALEELESGNIDKLTWANAIIAAQGDEVKAKAEYLKLRKIKS